MLLVLMTFYGNQLFSYSSFQPSVAVLSELVLVQW